jgi:transcriptional regulator with XRE-family HTH domain
MCSTRIKEIRLQKGITQEALAEAVGLSQAEVSRKENGITTLDVDSLKLFATALGVSVAELLGEKPQAS